MAIKIYGTTSNNGLLRTSGPFKDQSTATIAPIVITPTSIGKQNFFTSTNIIQTDITKVQNTEISKENEEEQEEQEGKE